MNNPITFSCVVSVLSFFLTFNSARAVKQALKPDEKGSPTSCAHSLAVLDIVAQNAPKNELVIVIARLGDGETKQELNRRRLHNVKNYLTKFLTHESVRRNPETVILAEGEKANGYGRVEFYVKGKLFDRLPIRTGSDLIVGDCYTDHPKGMCAEESSKDFYPCRDKHLTNRKRRRR